MSEPDHEEFEKALTELERRAEEQAAQLRRIQIELDIFAREEDDARDRHH